MQKPNIKYEKILKRESPPTPILSIASGIKSKNAAPIKVPAEKATKNKRILSNIFSFKNKVTAPTNEIKLIKNVERSIQKRIDMLSIKCVKITNFYSNPIEKKIKMIAIVFRLTSRKRYGPRKWDIIRAWS